jgi:hypothetical protein
LEEVLEASARLLEADLIRAFHIGPGVKSEWRERSIFGVYQPVYDWLLTELRDVFISRAAIEVSLLGPVDLCCAAKGPVIAYVEDCLPSWRLVRAVEAIKNSFWTDLRSVQELEVKERIALRAGIPTPADVVSAALSEPILDKSAWSFDMKALGVLEDATVIEYLYYCESEIRRGLGIRDKDHLAFLRPETPDVFQPAIEFYKDTALLHESPISRPRGAHHLKAFQTLVGNLGLLSLLGDGDLSDVSKIQRSFSNAVSQLSASSNERVDWNSMCDAQRIVRDVLGDTIFSRLSW